tara:strand:+ start:1092 stop:1880 length:789 start_codon:yes stop_codon:yes gene_type:complete
MELFLLADCNDYEGIERHIKQYPFTDINKTDEKGYTPLYVACMQSNLKAMKVLLKYNADINIKTFSGVPILHQLCSDLAHYSTFMPSLDYRKTHNNEYDTIMPYFNEKCISDYEKKLEIIEYILEKNSNINITDSDGNTALHISCEELAYVEVFHLLMKYNANIDIKNNLGQTPMQILNELLNDAEENFNDIYKFTKLYNSEDYGTVNYKQEKVLENNHINQRISLIKEHLKQKNMEKAYSCLVTNNKTNTEGVGPVVASYI